MVGSILKFDCRICNGICNSFEVDYSTALMVGAFIYSFCYGCHLSMQTCHGAIGLWAIFFAFDFSVIRIYQVYLKVQRVSFSIFSFTWLKEDAYIIKSGNVFGLWRYEILVHISVGV